MKKIKMDYNFYLGPGKLRPKELKARSVTYRHLVSLRASSPFGDIVKSRRARGIGTREETRKRGAGERPRPLARAFSRGLLRSPLSSAEASLYCREAFVLWGGWGERKRERAGHDGKGEERREAPAVSLFPSSPARFLFFRLLIFSWGYPAGASAEERAPLAQIGELARRLAFSARWIRRKGEQRSVF